MKSWEEYHKRTNEMPPRDLVIEAVSWSRNRETALDLGAGSLRDTNYLSGLYSEVTAVDIEPSVADRNKNENVTVIISSFEKLQLSSDAYDFINAQFSLPFIHRDEFSQFFKSVLDSLRESGIFCGQFFGVDDEWNTPGSKMTFLTKSEVEEYLKELSILKLEEISQTGKTAAGELKYWHIFNVIAQK